MTSIDLTSFQENRRGEEGGLYLRENDVAIHAKRSKRKGGGVIAYEFALHFAN